MMQMAAEAHEHINNQSWLATWVLDSGMGAAILGAAVTLRVVRRTTSKQTEQHLSSQTLAEEHHSNEIKTVKVENDKAMAAQRSLFDEERTTAAAHRVDLAGIEAQTNLMLVATWISCLGDGSPLAPLSSEDCKSAGSVLLANGVNQIILRDYLVGIAQAQGWAQSMNVIGTGSRAHHTKKLKDEVRYITAVTKAFLDEIGQDPLTKIKA